MAKKLGFILLFTLHSLQFAQGLPQLRLVGQPEKSATEFVGSNIVDVNGKICAAIQVLSDLDGLQYDVYNQLKRVDRMPGRDMVYVQAEEQVLEILHSGYQPLKLVLLESGIRLASREVWVIKISGDKKITELPVAIITTPQGAEVFIDGDSRGSGEQHNIATGTHLLRLNKPGYVPVEETIRIDEKNALFRFELKKMEDIAILIASEPTGATVYLDGIKLGTTPASAFYAPGKYKLRLELDWYVPYEEEVVLATPRTERRIRLQENFARLTVQSAPQNGLDIYLNDLPQQSRTPFTFERLAAGNYRVKARSGQYETAEETMVLAAGDRKTVNLMSSASFATLTIRTKPGVTVYLNGKKLEQLENVRLEPSIAVLRAELAKAPTVEQRVTLRKGETQTIELMPVVPVGTIQVAVSPFEAQVELHGDGGEYYAATGAKIFADVPVGTYTLKVSFTGYPDKQETLVLKAGEKINRSVTLERSAPAQPDLRPAQYAAEQPAAVQFSTVLPQIPTSGGIWRDPKTGIEFVLVKGGTFEMGDVFGEGFGDEKPVHSVTVGDFYLGVTEVTVGQFRAFCQATGYNMPEEPYWRWHYDHPIVNVSWNDALAYCNWAGYRLPTEAEWEYAAREGGRKVRFGNGKDTADPTEINFDGREQYKETYSVAGVYRSETTAVASFAANALGLVDMSGNVWEWCSDWYEDGYYRKSPQDNPPGPISGMSRVLRGGSNYDQPSACRVTNRNWFNPDNHNLNNGFRVARPAQ